MFIPSCKYIQDTNKLQNVEGLSSTKNIKMGLKSLCTGTVSINSSQLASPFTVHGTIPGPIPKQGRLAVFSEETCSTNLVWHLYNS